MVAERLAGRHGISLKKKGYQALYGVGRIDGVESTLLLPQTFMNLSGASVAAACKSLGVPAEDLVVVHDDIDLPFGVLKLRCGGGHGGHNGIRSICAVLGESSFARVKVGVGRPPAGGDVAGYVLNPFSSAERARLDAVVDNAAAAVEALLVRGVQLAMNEFNNRDIANT